MVNNVTVLLKKMSDGDSAAPEELLPLVYDELRKLAASYLRKERSDHTLQPTALVHEAYIRLVDWENSDWKNRAHFFAVAAQSMRNILVDHARRKKTAIHGGNLQKLALDEAIGFSQSNEVDLVDLDDALGELEKLDDRQSKIVELRFFGGLTIEETAHALNVSPMTVSRDWNFAKAWLYRRLSH
ncbi:MAG: sigma-70 family RNA polymerase sigma factor [Acidobacteria bacterium]|nr:sigma-70 family RNA polymerase sigma factor [Acidobacteriota bacterium]